MSVGIVLVSVAALVAGGWLWRHRDAPKTTTGLFGVAGLALGGVLGNALAGVLAPLFATHLDGAGTDGSGLGVWGWVRVVLVAVSMAVTIAASVEVVVKGMWRRRATPRRWHPWLALALPTVAIAIGVPLVGPVMNFLAGGVGAISTAMTGTPIAGHPATAHDASHITSAERR